MRIWHLPRERWLLPRGGGIMGILNVTPDSFSDGGLHHSVDAALHHAACMVQEGAHIIDIGGESTRPGASPVSEKEELRRTAPVVRALRQQFPALRISIDTRHAAVAAAALEAGADIVNDISGLEDADMRRICAEAGCGVILMHMQGTPATMQQHPHYTDVVAEVRAFFEQRISLAEESGIDPQRICLDPGIGFGKNTQHNLALIRQLEELRVQNLPLMMALSRKRFMGELLQDPVLPKESPLPTVAMSLLAAERGADLHRVHDVAALQQALALRNALLAPDAQA